MALPHDIVVTPTCELRAALRAGVAVGGDGFIYGAASAGGSGSQGSVFRVDA